jgi:FMN-dependent oxidoreductase (nitrilotriacetate monooxygenase family)
MTRELHLNLFIYGRGHHEASWRHPRSTGESLTDIGYYQRLAATAERGRFDSMFLADHLVLNDQVEHRATAGLEPLTTLAALAGTTSRLGLIATASATFTEPFNLARQFASIDHISGGRVGWNMVTSWAKDVEANFSRDRGYSHDERYERAHEFVDVVTALWDSWADDAVIDDPTNGQYVDMSRVRSIDYRGAYQQVRGPLNIPRPVQGRPVLVQAGSSGPGRQFAARFAEAVFTAQMHIDGARQFYSGIKSEVRRQGRQEDSLLVLPGISPVVGSTDAEARRLQAELSELSLSDVGLQHLSARFGGADLSHLALDEPLSVHDLPPADRVQGAQSRAQLIAEYVAAHRPTLRELLDELAGGRGHFVVVGPPERVADAIEGWFRTRAADGFNVMPPLLPAGLDDFVEFVVPLLQERGLFRREYAGTTLREHYGLGRPGNHFTADASATGHGAA